MLKIVPFISLFLLFNSITHSQNSQMSLRTNIGVAYLPFSDWKNNFGSTISNYEYYDSGDPIIYGGLSIHYRINKYHSINIGSEILNQNIHYAGQYEGMITPDSMGVIPIKIEWRMRGIPFTIGYEYHTNYFKDNFEPIFGIGCSYFFSHLDAISVIPYRTTKATRSGKGYGLHSYIAFSSKITPKISSLWQVRYRYSNGMAFTDEKGNVKVQFSGLDFSIGLNYSI